MASEIRQRAIKTSFEQSAEINQVENKEKTLKERVLDTFRNSLQNQLKEYLELLKGASIWMPCTVIMSGIFAGYAYFVQGRDKADIEVIINFATPFAIFKSIFHPETLRLTSVEKEINSFNFYRFAKEAKSELEEFGNSIPQNFNPELIKSSICPKEEYLNQMSILDSLEQNVNTDSNPKSFELMAGTMYYQVLLIPMLEECFWRGVIQDKLLKGLVRKVVEKVAPNHLSKIDSKIYTGIRILLTSIAFGSSHAYGKNAFPDHLASGLVAQAVTAVFMGIGFGILKEKYGLSASIGAHTIQNLGPGLTAVLSKC